MNTYNGVRSIKSLLGYKYGAANQFISPTLDQFDPDLEELKAVSQKMTPEELIRACVDISGKQLFKHVADLLRATEEKVISQIRRDLLVFDKIYVEDPKFYASSNKIRDELESLKESGYIGYMDIDALSLTERKLDEKGNLMTSRKFQNVDAGYLWVNIVRMERTIDEYEHCLHLIKNGEDSFRSLDDHDWEDRKSRFLRLKRIGYEEAYREYVDYAQFFWDLVVRMGALLINDCETADSTPLLTSSRTFEMAIGAGNIPVDVDALTKSNIKTDVAHLVIKNVPTISKNTPLESIVDYKNDEGARLSRLRLRKWMRESIRSGKSKSEVHEELEYLMLEYKNYMEHHNLKVTYGTFQSLLVTSAEVFENVAKLNLGKAAASLFSVHNRRIALTEAEMNAPGREVAYLLKVQSKYT